MSAARVLLGWAVGCVVLAVAVGGGVVALNRLDEAALPADDAPRPQRPRRSRGRPPDARAGNRTSRHTRCGGRHTPAGRAIDTPFGAVHASNLTPDDATGIGLWSAGEFWRALQ